MSQPPIRCKCGSSEHAVRRPLTRTVPAPWYYGIANLLGARLPTMVEQRCGSVVTCHGEKCGETFAIGDSGARDTWMPPPEANSPVALPREREESGKPKDKAEPDPGDGLRVRTLRP